METLYAGKLKGVHGIKGELKFDKVINANISVGNKIIINNNEYEITSLRMHKGLYLITLNNMNDINLVFGLKNYDVYINRDNIKEELIPEDLIDYLIICDNNDMGKVIDIINGLNLLLVIDYNHKKYYIPYYGDFIIDINKDKKEINVSINAKELII